MDFAEFRFSACVDWVDILFTTDKPTTYAAIRNRIRVTFADPHDETPDGTAQTFTARWHDPRCWAHIERDLRAVGAVGFQATAIEIAFDGYAKTPDARQRLPILCAHMLKGNKSPQDNARFAGAGQGKKEPPISFENSINQFSAGKTLEFGDKGADSTGRIYFKTTNDARKGKSRPISENEYRARYEKTYRGDLLPGITSGSIIEVIGSHDFKFRKIDPSESRPAIIEALLDRAPQIGTRQARQTRKGDRLYDSNTVADGDLNERARQALRSLAQRWAKP